MSDRVSIVGELFYLLEMVTKQKIYIILFLVFSLILISKGLYAQKSATARTYANRIFQISPQCDEQYSSCLKSLQKTQVFLDIEPDVPITPEKTTLIITERYLLANHELGIFDTICPSCFRIAILPSNFEDLNHENLNRFSINTTEAFNSVKINERVTELLTILSSRENLKALITPYSIDKGIFKNGFKKLSQLYLLNVSGDHNYDNSFPDQLSDLTIYLTGAKIRFGSVNIENANLFSGSPEAHNTVRFGANKSIKSVNCSGINNVTIDKCESLTLLTAHTTNLSYQNSSVSVSHCANVLDIQVLYTESLYLDNLPKLKRLFFAQTSRFSKSHFSLNRLNSLNTIQIIMDKEFSTFDLANIPEEIEHLALESHDLRFVENFSFINKLMISVPFGEEVILPKRTILNCYHLNCNHLVVQNDNSTSQTILETKKSLGISFKKLKSLKLDGVQLSRKLVRNVRKIDSIELFVIDHSNDSQKALIKLLAGKRTYTKICANNIDLPENRKKRKTNSKIDFSQCPEVYMHKVVSNFSLSKIVVTADQFVYLSENWKPEFEIEEIWIKPTNLTSKVGLIAIEKSSKLISAKPNSPIIKFKE
jgi:hypothetical protein